MENPFDAGYYGSEELRAFGFKSVGENVRVAKDCTIVGLDHIELADHCRIDGYCTIVATEGWLRIGRYVHVHTSVVLGARGGLELADYAGVSHGCQLLSAADDFTGRWMTNSTLPENCTRPRIAPILIGKHVPIGTCCTVLPGVSIGEGAAVCSHSVVSHDVPEWVIVQGTPAEIRSRRIRRALALTPAEPEGAAA